MDNRLKHQIERIEKIVEVKEQELEMMNFEKYKGLFELAAKFLSKRRVLLYGGLAIDELMPNALKIYKPNTLPDIDVFTPDAEKLADGLVNMFKRQKYELSSYSEALHPGTYKVFVSGVQVADITQCSNKAFKRLSEGSRISSLGIRVVSPEFLRMSLHKMMSQPNDAHRWPKVFARLIYFYKVFPVTGCGIRLRSQGRDDDGDGDKKLVMAHLTKVLEDSKCILFGTRELSWLLQKDIGDQEGVPPLQAFVESDLADFTRQLVPKELQHNGLAHSVVYAADEFIPDHVFITFKGKKVACIFQADGCLSFNRHKETNVANIHTILRIYLSMMLSSYAHFEQMGPYLECYANILTVLQQKSGTSKRKLLQQFVSNCYGPQIGMVTLRRERIKRILHKGRDAL